MGVEKVGAAGTTPVTTDLGQIDNFIQQLTGIRIGQYMQGVPVDAQGLTTQAQSIAQTGDGTDSYDARARELGVDSGQTLGAQPSTASPGVAYSQQALQTAGTYYVPLSTAGVKLENRGRLISGSHLASVMNERNASGDFKYGMTRNALINKHGLVQGQDGQWMMPVNQPAVGDFANMVPGLNLSSSGLTAGNNLNGNIGQSVVNNLNRNSWLLPVAGFATMGLGGLAAGMVVSNGLRGLTGGNNNGLGLAMAGLSMGAGGSSLVNTFRAAEWGGYATIAATFDGVGGFTTSGLEASCRHIMNSYARESQLDSVLQVIQSGQMPIEDLIFFFMAAMNDQYEEKLREAMEKAVIAEKLEQRRDRRTEIARVQAGMVGAVGSMFSAIPIYGAMVNGATQMAGRQMEMKAIRENELESNLNGRLESATALQQRVQMLMHKWKQLNELFSNLVKALHDMAMTPIRNIR